MAISALILINSNDYPQFEPEYWAGGIAQWYSIYLAYVRLRSVGGRQEREWEQKS